MKTGYGTTGYKEHNADIAQQVDTLFLLDHEGLANEYVGLQRRATLAALAFAKTQLLKYSAEHPQRECILCVAMGTATLHVESWVYGRREDYQFSAGDSDKGIPAPEFLNRLARLGEAIGQEHQHWFGPVRLVAHHGALIGERGNW